MVDEDHVLVVQGARPDSRCPHIFHIFRFKFDCQLIDKKMSALTLTPSDVIHAMNVPNFYQQTSAFWNMCGFLFTKQNEQHVWMQIPADTYFKMGEQLHSAVEAFETQGEQEQQASIFYQTYFVILTKTRQQQTQTEWLAHSPPDFLQSMHKMYRLLFSMRVPPMPNFGNHHPNLLQ